MEIVSLLNRLQYVGRCKGLFKMLEMIEHLRLLMKTVMSSRGKLRPTPIGATRRLFNCPC